MEDLVFEKHVVNGKPICIFESHNFAIVPWAEFSNRSDMTPYLISFDYHTDTMPAFRRYANMQSQGDENTASALRQTLCENINARDERSVLNAAQFLSHDEHIDASIKSGIITHSFSIQYSNTSGTLSNEMCDYIDGIPSISDILSGLIVDEPRPEPVPPFSYSIPQNKMFILPNRCAVGCSRMPHDDDCRFDHPNQALEDVFLHN